jgi:hypothetical protein
MNAKIVLGIIIPAVIIIILTIISSLDIGFSAQNTYTHDLDFDDIFTNSQVRNSIEIGKVTITNDYFLPKRYDLPAITACLVDEDKEKQIQDVGSVSYSEGDSESYGSTDLYYYGGSNNNPTSVEIGAHEKKTVRLYLYPTSINTYDYSNLNKTEEEIVLETYGDYDSLILIEGSKSTSPYGYGYASCYSFSQSELDDGIKISLK